MKRCPECRRDYFDDSLLYCLDDGSALLEGPASFEESATAILHEAAPPSGTAAREQIHTIEQRAVLPAGSGSLAGEVSGEKGFDKRLLFIPLLLAVVVSGGFIGYRYLGLSSRGGPITSIAVLPLDNRSANADSEYLSDGLAESLIFRLSQLPGLKVSPVSSVIRYKGVEFDAKKIASELGVQAVMSGRLAQRGENLTVSIELIDAANNKIIWGEQYERKMSDLLATQREIAATIAQKLQVKLGGEDKGVTKKYTDNNEAYQLYLKGRFHFDKRTKADMEKSVELLQQATRLDPNFALAYVGIAESYTIMPSYSYISPADAAPRARASIERALQIDPDLPEARAVSAVISTTDWDYIKGEKEFKRAIELGPNLAITHYRYGWVFLSTVGRHDEAIAEMKRAMELEPLSVQQGSNYATVLMYARRFDEAVEQAKRTHDLDAKHIGARNWLCHSLNAAGRSEEVMALVENDRGDPNDSLLACKGVAHARTGNRDGALKIAAEINEAKRTRYVMSYWLAVVYAALGDRDAAFAELEASFRNRDWFLPRMKVDSFMDPLRGDPRFDAMLKRLNLPL